MERTPTRRLLKMKNLLVCIVVFFVMLSAYSAQAKVNVFACEPEWAALSQEIGGERINVSSATNAFQDPHYIRARPSLIAKVRKADLVICSGAELEVGWLPLLLRKASSDLWPGSVGYLMAADFVPMLEIPQVVDRSMGDIHPQGNPHVHLNPYNLLLVGKEFSNRLEKIDPENAVFYRSRHKDFSSRFGKAIDSWEDSAQNLRGKPIVVHHSSFIYLLDWLKMDQVATLETSPGLPPTASHLNFLLKQLKNKPAGAIIRTPYDPDDGSLWLEKKTGTKAIVLPYTVGGDEASGDLFSLFDQTIKLLLEAYGLR